MKTDMEESFEIKVPQSGGYREELENESKQIDPNSHASRLIKQEIDRLNKGEDEVLSSKKQGPMAEIHEERPRRVQVKIRIPVKEYPKYNFVGKLLGPKGNTLKALQDQLGCKLAIMGRGSMRDKDKEEELRKQGGKYSHFDDDLHVLIECYGETCEAYHRIAAAGQELKKFLTPQMEDMYDDGAMNGSGGMRGRGGFRGGPPMDRGGRGGGFRGRGSGPPPMASRGSSRGGPPVGRGGRGTPRGGAPPTRGGGRGSASSGSYDGYGAQGYSSSYDSGYDNYGGQSYSGGDSGYYDYSANQGSGYDSYSGYDYGGDSWNTGGGKAAAPSNRGSSRGQSRSHPYPRS